MAQHVEVRWLVGDDNDAVRWIVQQRMIPRLHTARVHMVQWARMFASSTQEETVTRMLYWVRGHMLFTDDPPGEELIKSPLALMQEIAMLQRAVGDCDDYVMLFGGLVHAADVPLRLTVMARKPVLDITGNEYQIDHVYTHVRMDNTDWIPIDPTGTAAIGWEQTPHYLKESYDV